MSIFESLGQQTERIKQKFTGTTSYECASCEASLTKNYEQCPNCGSDDISPEN